jgi:hypothetical protein
MSVNEFTSVLMTSMNLSMPVTFSISIVSGRSSATAASKAGMPLRWSSGPSPTPAAENGWHGGPATTHVQGVPAMKLAGSGCSVVI